MKDYSDEKLVQLLSYRDNEALNELYLRYSSMMFSFFLSMSKSRELAEDLTQDIFIKLIDKADRYKQKISFKSWLFRMARNMYLDKYRFFKMEMRKLDIVKHKSDKIDNETDDIRHIVIKHLDCLKPKKRMCFVMRYLHDFSISEIGEIMKCSEGTVRSRLHYAKEELKKKIGSNIGDYYER